MPTRFERWILSKLLAIVFGATEDDQRHALILVAHGRVGNGHLLAGGLVDSPAAFGVRGQAVAKAHVGEGAAHHDLVIAAPGTVGVELPGRHLPLL
jgi:small ligand-binding sensory domain FIST